MQLWFDIFSLGPLSVLIIAVIIILFLKSRIMTKKSKKSPNWGFKSLCRLQSLSLSGNKCVIVWIAGLKETNVIPAELRRSDFLPEQISSNPRDGHCESRLRTLHWIQCCIVQYMSIEVDRIIQHKTDQNLNSDWASKKTEKMQINYLLLLLTVY